MRSVLADERLRQKCIGGYSIDIDESGNKQRTDDSTSAEEQGDNPFPQNFVDDNTI